MNIDELNAKYDEIYNKNAEIQVLFTELEDYSDILFFLYETEIKRPNAVLNTMIDKYESLIFKIRESHKDIKDSLAEFGDEKELAEGVTQNENLTEKVKELILWKLRRLFMIYDETPILPYVEGDFINTELIGSAPPEEPAEEPEEAPAEEEGGKEEDASSAEAGLFPTPSKEPN